MSCNRASKRAYEKRFRTLTNNQWRKSTLIAAKWFLSIFNGPGSKNIIRNLKIGRWILTCLWRTMRYQSLEAAQTSRFHSHLGIQVSITHTHTHARTCTHILFYIMISTLIYLSAFPVIADGRHVITAVGDDGGKTLAGISIGDEVNATLSFV